MQSGTTRAKGITASVSLCLCGSSSPKPVKTAANLVKRRDAAAKRLHVLPDLVVLLARFLVHLAHARELQVRLKVPQRAIDVVEVIGEKPAVAQFAERRWRERHEQLG